MASELTARREVYETWSVDIETLVSGMGPRDFLAIYNASGDELAIEPHSQDGYFFVTVISLAERMNHGTKRAIARSSVARAVEILNFDTSGQCQVSKWQAPPLEKNWKVDKAPRVKRSTNDNSVYFIQADIGGPIKIGHSDRIESRLETLQAGCPFKLEVIGFIETGGFALEKRLHARFAKHRLHGEWFEPVEELLDYIEKEASQWNG